MSVIIGSIYGNVNIFEKYCSCSHDSCGTMDLLAGSSVRVVVDDRYVNSGFFISGCGHVLTCCHAGPDSLMPGRRVDVQFMDRDFRWNFFEGRVLESHSGIDYALIETGFKNLCCIPLGTRWQVGEMIMTYGYSFQSAGNAGDSHTGMLIGTSRLEKPEGMFQYLALQGDCWDSGLSGAPVYNMRTRKACGIVSAGMAGGNFRGISRIYAGMVEAALAMSSVMPGLLSSPERI